MVKFSFSACLTLQKMDGVGDGVGTGLNGVGDGIGTGLDGVGDGVGTGLNGTGTGLDGVGDGVGTGCTGFDLMQNCDHTVVQCPVAPLPGVSANSLYTQKQFSSARSTEIPVYHLNGFFPSRNQ
jgi:hypothetical protein